MSLFVHQVMPKTKQGLLYELAEPQHGYFTSSQATRSGLLQNTLTQMANRGVIQRVSRGVYRLVNFPPSDIDQYIEAMLWPQRGTKGVISHQSALVLHGLSDVSPAKMHITIDPDYRVRRDPPGYLVVHYDRLEEDDTEVLDGVTVTTPVRSIIDCHASHLNTALVRQAIDDGRRNGKLLARDVEKLNSLIAANSPSA